MKNFLKHVAVVILVILFELITYWTCDAQGVGVGTTNPQAMLHVAGNVRIDTVTAVGTTKKIVAIDSVGVLHTLLIDSLKKSVVPILFSQEVNAQTSTQSSTLQPRVTLNLLPGTYLLFAYFEGYNVFQDAGVRAALYEGTTELAYSIVYANTSTYGSWNTFKVVSPTVATNYILYWGAWPNQSPAYIKRARIAALKIM